MTDEPKPRWTRLIPKRYSAIGLIGGSLFLWASLTPSLLPRSAAFQGAVSALATAVGYGVGILFLKLASYMLERPLAWRPSRRAAAGLANGFAVLTIIALVRYADWQSELRTLMGLEQLSWGHYVGLVAIATVLAFVLVLVARLIASLTRRLVGRITRIAPPRVAGVAGVGLVVLLGVGILNGVVVDRLTGALDATFKVINDETHADSPAPSISELSGSADSLVTWDSLGRTGREFIENASTTDELTGFSGTTATQPIRAYVGLGSRDTIAEEAQLAVDELIRARAFQRSVICVVTTTGTGWLNEDSVAAVEYLYNGDSAIVGMQYSYLPSWMSFLVDQARAREAGRQLFNAVYAYWVGLPETSRPKLVVNGESLGSFGAETAFSGVDDLRNRTDGALFVGPPFMNDLWRDLTDHRDDGSPEWLPIYQNGQTVRFMARPSDLDRPAAPWGDSRVVYLQYASDPITWWNPALIFSRPDWLEEERGYDVLPDTRWFPVVTFLQLSADMAVGHLAPDGHGHRFGSDPADAWAAILRPSGWTPEATARLRVVLADKATERRGY